MDDYQDGSMLREGDKWTHATRLIFTYQGTNIQLLSQESIRMIPPPSNMRGVTPNQSGFWVELQDTEGRPVYRHTQTNPIQYDREVFARTEERNIARTPVANPHGTFVLLVPTASNARRVVLFSSPPESDNAHCPAKEILCVDLDEHKSGKAD